MQFPCFGLCVVVGGVLVSKNASTTGHGDQHYKMKHSYAVVCPTGPQVQCRERCLQRCLRMF